MAKNVTIRISAEDNFSTVVDKFNQKMGSAADTAKKVGDAGGGAESGLSKLNGVLTTAAGIFAAVKSAEFVADIVNMGREASKTKEVFAALTAPMGDYNTVIESMRTATGGIVDDMTLMQGSSKLVQMGLATTTDELARLSEMAVKLGGTMGMDATKAMSDFSLMLANQSIMRLDQFGISGARVRDEIERLLKSGQALNRDEAFKLAVLDQGAKALERLGNAADAASTPLARLETRIANIAQQGASNVATGVEGIVGLLEVWAGQNPIQIQQREQAAAAAKTFVSEYQSTFMEYASMTGMIPADMMADLGGDAGRQLLDGMYRELQANPEADVASILFQQTGINANVSDVGKGIVDAFNTTFEMASAAVENEMANKEFADANARWLDMVNGIFSVPGELYQQGQTVAANLLKMANENGVIKQLEDNRKRLEQEQREGQILFKKMADDVTTFAKGIDNALNTVPQRMGALVDLYYAVGNVQANLATAYGAAYQYQPGAADTNLLTMLQGGGVKEFQMPELPQYMTGEQAREIRSQFEAAALEVERLQGLVDAGLINDSELDKARGLKDNIGLMADQAERAADAFANIKLSDIFGTSGGGMGGEVTDLVLQRMKENGATPEQIAAMQRALDLQSGRETVQSLFMKEQMVPKIANMTPEQAAMVQGNVTGAFGAAALLGFQPWQLTNMNAMMGIGPNGQPISTMNPEILARMGAGQGPEMLKGGFNAIANMLGIGGGKEGEAGSGLTGAMDTVNTKMAEVKASADGAAGSFAGMTTELDKSESSLTTMQRILSDISGVYNVKVNLSVDGLGVLATLLGLGGGGGGGNKTGVAGTVRDNGGRVPGATARTVARD